MSSAALTSSSGHREYPSQLPPAKTPINPLSGAFFAAGKAPQSNIIIDCVEGLEGAKQLRNAAINHATDKEIIPLACEYLQNVLDVNKTESSFHFDILEKIYKIYSYFGVGSEFYLILSEKIGFKINETDFNEHGIKGLLTFYLKDKLDQFISGEIDHSCFKKLFEISTSIFSAKKCDKIFLDVFAHIFQQEKQYRIAKNKSNLTRDDLEMEIKLENQCTPLKKYIEMRRFLHLEHAYLEPAAIQIEVYRHLLLTGHLHKVAHDTEPLNHFHPYHNFDDPQKEMFWAYELLKKFIQIVNFAFEEPKKSENNEKFCQEFNKMILQISTQNNILKKFLVFEDGHLGLFYFCTVIYKIFTKFSLIPIYTVEKEPQPIVIMYQPERPSEHDTTPATTQKYQRLKQAIDDLFEYHLLLHERYDLLITQPKDISENEDKDIVTMLKKTLSVVEKIIILLYDGFDDYYASIDEFTPDELAVIKKDNKLMRAITLWNEQNILSHPYFSALKKLR